jgi:pimeloyl-ACP methyl ester carboxylesterase
MSIDATTFPRIGIPLAPPRLRLASEFLSTLHRESWPEPPSGAGRPVMLIPGFMAGDTSLTRMAVWLREGGYTLARTGIRWNTDCMEPTVVELQRRLERAVEEAGQPALLVGQSRGGSIGRALSVLAPDLIDTLVTLGSPLLDQLAVKARVWPSIVTVGALGTIGIPGMFSVACLRGSCCARTVQAITAPFPDHIRFVSVYSRSDEVVRWQSCLDAAALQLEVDSSHVGMAWAREVWTALTAELNAPRV